MNTQKEQRRIVGICPSCRESNYFTAEDSIQSTLHTVLTYGVCSHCSASLFTLELDRESVTTSIGVITDLTRTDAQHFLSQNRLCDEDIIAVQELFQQSTVVRYLHSNQ